MQESRRPRAHAAMLRMNRALARTTLPLAACLIFSVSLWAQETPKELQPPANEQILLKVHAKGDQIYSCKADGARFAWTLNGPDAQLFDKDGKLFGKHFAGPSWEANDGSRVT